MDESILSSGEQFVGVEDALTEEKLSIENLSLETKTFEIAGFWRRVLALVIDGLILSIPLIVLGFVFRDIAFSLGPWGRLIGYGVIFLYWTYFNSAQRRGQTIGKKVMKIAVIDSKGAYLSVGKSMLRAGVLVLIGLLNGWSLPLLKNPVVALVAGTIVFGGGLALIYGLVFNRKTRQGIHDLIVGSYVVKASPDVEAIVPVIPRIHKRITFGLVGFGLVLGLAGLFFMKGVANPTFGILEADEWQELQDLQTVLLGSDEFFAVNVQRLNRHRVGSEAVMKDLNVDVWVKKSCSREPRYCDELLKRVARIAFENYADIDNLTGMRITISNRFDLGLARRDLSQGAAWTIEDWRKQLE